MTVNQLKQAIVTELGKLPQRFILQIFYVYVGVYFSITLILFAK